MSTFTKKDFVENLASELDIPKKLAYVIFGAFIESMIDALKNGDEIELRGFGSFRIKTRKARTGRNPRTGERVEVPEKEIVYFKPGKHFKRDLE